MGDNATGRDLTTRRYKKEKRKEKGEKRKEKKGKRKEKKGKKKRKKTLKRFNFFEPSCFTFREHMSHIPYLSPMTLRPDPIRVAQVT